MRALVLWADGASTNLGVQVLARGAEALAHSAWPEASVEFLNYGSTTAPMRVGNARALGLELARSEHGLVDWLREFDVVLDTRGGDSFSDIYGLSRHVGMTLLAEAVRRSGTRYVLTPQTIGPFATWRGRRLASRTLRSADVVMARDAESANAAARLGRPVDLTTTDMVFALPQPIESVRYDVLLNVSGLLWEPNPHVDSNAYRGAVRGIHAALTAEGRRVTLLAHVLDSANTDNDVPAITSLAGDVGTDDVLIPESLDHVRTTLAGARVVIGSRMHACLNALSVGTPAVALAYSRKFKPLLSALNWDETVDLRTTGDATTDVVERLSSPDLRARAAAVQQTGAALMIDAAQALTAR